MKKGFTLAEVLITLGIIGVVAAVTIPTLIQNYRKHVVETRLEKFYSMINQAIQLSESENGERGNWALQDDDLTPLEWFNKYLSKYIKTIKTEEDETNRAIIYFPDGSLTTLSKGGDMHFCPVAKDFAYCMSLDDIKECSGRKYFNFFYKPNAQRIYDTELGFDINKYLTKNIEPYKYDWDGTLDGTYGIKTNPYFGCMEELPKYGRAYCATYIQMNGWKIPKDYPIRF